MKNKHSYPTAMFVPQGYCIVIGIDKQNIELRTSEGLKTFSIFPEFNGMVIKDIVKSLGYKLITIIPIITRFICIDDEKLLIMASINKYGYILIVTDINADIREVWHYEDSMHFACDTPNCKFMTNEQYKFFIDGFETAKKSKIRYDVA